jgi:hypothetical protein
MIGRRLMAYEIVRLILVINGESWDVIPIFIDEPGFMCGWRLKKGEEKYDVKEMKERYICSCRNENCIHIRACTISGLIV